LLQIILVRGRDGADHLLFFMERGHDTVARPTPRLLVIILIIIVFIILIISPSCLSALFHLLSVSLSFVAFATSAVAQFLALLLMSSGNGGSET
jgi:hypothetical protein